MGKCVKITRKIKRVCTGSLNRQISLFTRSIVTPDGITVDVDENLTLLKKVWAMIETTRGVTLFDSSNVERDISHRIYIRYIEALTAEIWVLLPSVTGGIDNLIDVVRLENLEEGNRFMLLSCAIRGDDSKKVNLA